MAVGSGYFLLEADGALEAGEEVLAACFVLGERCCDGVVGVIVVVVVVYRRIGVGGVEVLDFVVLGVTVGWW